MSGSIFLILFQQVFQTKAEAYITKKNEAKARGLWNEPAELSYHTDQTNSVFIY